MPRTDETSVRNEEKIIHLINWQSSVDRKLEKIQNRQNLEMTVLFLSIATFLISHFT